MSKLSDKLGNLLRLATLKPGEEANDARVNEARTASFLLIKTCQDNGVTLSFKLPKQAAPPPEQRGPGPQGTYPRPSRGANWGPQGPPPMDPNWSPGPAFADFGDFMDWMAKQRVVAGGAGFKRPRAHKVSAEQRQHPRDHRPPPGPTFRVDGEAVRPEDWKAEYKKAHAQECAKEQERSRDERCRAAGEHEIHMLSATRYVSRCSHCSRPIDIGSAIWRKVTLEEVFYAHEACGFTSLIPLGRARGVEPDQVTIDDEAFKQATDGEPGGRAPRSYEYKGIDIGFDDEGHPVPGVKPESEYAHKVRLAREDANRRRK